MKKKITTIRERRQTKMVNGEKVKKCPLMQGAYCMTEECALWNTKHKLCGIAAYIDEGAL